MEFGALQLYGVYEVTGHVLYIPTEGKRFTTATLGPVNITIRIEGELIEVDGVEYYNTSNIKVTESIKDMKVTLEGLFGSDEKL
ncbi:hypothetical protein ILUMI_00504, partial [Ignelater luminosus]